MKTLFFDLETTGTNFWQHGIHQISGFVDIDGTDVDSFDIRLQPNPNARIEQSALEVANITEEQIKQYQPMKKGYLEFVSILDKYVDKYKKQDKFFLAGFNNAAFDNAFLRALFVQNDNQYFGSYFWPNPLDVYVLASERLKEQRTSMVDFKLRTVCQVMGIEVDESKLHDALYDVELTRKLYYALIS